MTGRGDGDAFLHRVELTLLVEFSLKRAWHPAFNNLMSETQYASIFRRRLKTYFRPT